MSLPDTVKALAQAVPAVASPVSWETAVFGFSSVVALYLGKTLKRVDEKVSQTLVLLHGVPEQNGKGGLVQRVDTVEATLDSHGRLLDFHNTNDAANRDRFGRIERHLKDKETL